MPLQETSGAASYDAFGGGVAAVPNYIEDVFSTWLYTGTGANQTITNSIGLSTKGGLVWIKDRTQAFNNALQDTVRGPSNILFSNDTVANQAYSTSITSFGTTGFTLGSETLTNLSGDNFVSWTFRKQPKFFDVVTWTGNSTAGRQISHNLGSVPGFIAVKATNNGSDWFCYHRSLGGTKRILLNSTGAAATDSNAWNNTDPTSTVFTVGAGADVNYTGITYVAYIYAHDAGGFGLTGTDNVITCGSYSGNSSTQSISLGYEPQFIMIKCTSTAGTPWVMLDTMRGWANSDASGFDDARLMAQSSAAESLLNFGTPTATGFNLINDGDTNGSGRTYVYIAIRRGPMKVPTDATTVFKPVSQNASSTTNNPVTAGFPVDSAWSAERSAAIIGYKTVFDRLRNYATQGGYFLQTQATNAEYPGSASYGQGFDSNTALLDNYWGNSFGPTATDAIIYWMFRRAPSFFDEVCATSTSSSNKSVTHNLASVPELMIVKTRSAATNWVVYASPVTTLSQYLVLNTTAAKATSANIWGLSSPTTTTFNINESTVVGGTGATYVAYLFATLAGVSKVGSYTGTGTTKQVDCGFTGGARFVLIKRTDSTGDWYVWDTARGIVAGNDPYLLLNSTAAEVTTTDYIDTYSAGFEISSTAPAAINASGGTFIFLAIA